MATPSHAHPAERGTRELGLALALTLGMMAVEFAVGWASGSLALVADAIHMLADAGALTLSLVAAWIATRPASLKRSYGYHRMEILAALANGIALWVLVIWIYGYAFIRLRHPETVHSGPMLVVAVIGLIVNLFIARRLRRLAADSMNVEGARLNVLSDALGSVGVIIAAVCVGVFGWHAADPIASLVIGALIGMTSWDIVKRSINVLLEGTPGHVSIPELLAALRSVPGVRDVHDIHCWTITTGMDALSGHVTVDDLARSTEILTALETLLRERFNITHTTIQLEPPDQ